MTLLEKIHHEAKANRRAWERAVSNGTAAQALREDPYYYYGDWQLRRWRDVMGEDREPIIVPVGCTAYVGRFMFRTTKPSLPNVVKMLHGAKGPGRRTKPHARLCSFSHDPRPWHRQGGATSTRRLDVVRKLGTAQREAYERAIASGVWA